MDSGNAGKSKSMNSTSTLDADPPNVKCCCLSVLCAKDFSVVVVVKRCEEGAVLEEEKGNDPCFKTLEDVAASLLDALLINSC